jgi:hypothetical protein
VPDLCADERYECPEDKRILAELFSTKQLIALPRRARYTGSFEIFGGSNADAGNPLAKANFQINATPEPGTWILLATGLGILAMGNFGRRYLPRSSAT